MRDALFALIWAAILPLSLFSAHLGVLVWVWIAMISPGEVLFGFMSDVPYNKLIALSTLAVLVFGGERKQFYLDRTLLAMLLLGLLGTASAFTSLTDSADGWDLYGKLLKELMLAFIICSVMGTRHRLHMLLIAICLGFGFQALSQGGQFLVTAGAHKVEGTGSVGDNNSLAVAILMIIPPLYYLMQYAAWRPAKLAYLGVIAASVLAVMATYSRGGFIGLVVLAAMFLLNSRRKLRGALIIAAAAGLILVSAPASWYERQNTLNNTSEDSSFMERVTVWKVSTLIALDHPVSGGGFHAVQRWPVWLAYTPKLGALDFITTPPPDPVPRAAHSTYFEILGDLGFLGLAIFLAMLAFSLGNCRRVRRLARTDPNLAWAGDMAQMVQISMVVYCITTISLSMGYFEGLYIFAAVTSRLLKTARESVAVAVPQAALRRVTMARAAASGASGAARPAL